MRRRIHSAIIGLLCAGFAAGAMAAAPDDAVRFGVLEAASSAELSADGKRLVFVGPVITGGTEAVVVELATLTTQRAMFVVGPSQHIRECNWVAADRLVCAIHGVTKMEGTLLPFSRFVALDSNGANQRQLGVEDSTNQLQVRQFDGFVVDWLGGTDGTVLMSRRYVPEFTTGKATARTTEGLGVDRINTLTGRSAPVERPALRPINYISDGLGNVRLKTEASKDAAGNLRDDFIHFYRGTDNSNWRKLAENEEEYTYPLAVDPLVNAAYVLQRQDGRLALFRITLDKTLRKELVFASPEVDVANVVRMGRAGRVIGAAYVTDRRQVEYFEPGYQSLAKSLSRALPNQPMIHFLSASADEQVLLIRADSDIEPGRYFAYDRGSKKLAEIFLARPALENRTLSAVRHITYPAADGTPIPAYLTLPPRVTEAKNLPAIVLPHGGPTSRDEWGFDWLAQFFAQRGFAVLQPNFRGSSGYGEQWYVNNGFRSWKTSVGDVVDGARWLVAQGMADPAKLATVGWSYGGYAALQANALAADLFKAIVAIAPVTDLAQLKREAMPYDNARLVANFIGSGAHVREGSPARNVAAFQAPVLLFHGDMDVNVEMTQSITMHKELRDAGKSSEMVVYPGLDHSLADARARTGMLRRIDAFLRTHLKMQEPQAVP